MGVSGGRVVIKHVVIVDGVPLVGFADGDYLEIKVDGGGASRTQGGDGPSMNLHTKQGGTLTLGLLPTSPSLGPLYELREAQQLLPRLFSVQVLTGTLETISAIGCAFGDLPGFSTGGPQMSKRQFPIEALNIILDQSVAAPIGAI